MKRPAGIFSFHIHRTLEDVFGVWLYVPGGSAWQAPHDADTLPYSVLILVSPHRGRIGWWVGDPAYKRIEIDVCLFPLKLEDGWSFIDLDPDLVRYKKGAVELKHRDEFETACRNGWIPPAEAEAPP